MQNVENIALLKAPSCFVRDYLLTFLLATLWLFTGATLSPKGGLAVSAQLVGSISATAAGDALPPAIAYGSTSATLSLPAASAGSFTINVVKANQASTSYTVFAHISRLAPSQSATLDGVPLPDSGEVTIRQRENFGSAYPHTLVLSQADCGQGSSQPVLIIRMTCNFN